MSTLPDHMQKPDWYESLKDSAVMMIATQRMQGTMLEDIVWATEALNDTLEKQDVAHSKSDNAEEVYSLQMNILIITLFEHYDIEAEKEDFKPFSERFLGYELEKK